MEYSQERREAILQKLLAPNYQSVAEVAEAEGISAATLYLWRKQVRASGRLLPNLASDPDGWRTQDKFNAVLETATLSEEELVEYCRRDGVYPEQIRRWRASYEHANDQTVTRTRQNNDTLKRERQRRRQVERELKRKEAALAETAALLTLRKKPRRSGETRTYDPRPGLPTRCHVGPRSPSARGASAPGLRYSASA